MNHHTLEEILLEIKARGSVRKAAPFLGLSVETISRRFRRLPEGDPLRERYNAVRGLQGRHRNLPADSKRERNRAAAARYRAKVNGTDSGPDVVQ